MRHQTISFIKSGLRMVGYICLVVDTQLAVITLLLSEVIGIYEEFGHE